MTTYVIQYQLFISHHPTQLFGTKKLAYDYAEEHYPREPYTVFPVTHTTGETHECHDD